MEFRDGLADSGKLIVGFKDLYEVSIGGSGDLDGSFFGFQIDKIGSCRDPFAFLFEPLTDLDFGDAFTDSGDDDRGHRNSDRG